MDFQESIAADQKQAQAIVDAVSSWWNLTMLGKCEVKLIAELFDKPYAWALEYYPLVAERIDALDKPAGWQEGNEP